MSISFAAKFEAPDHVLIRELDGELVLLNLETEQYFGMDQTSTRFWQALSEQPTIDAAFARLVDEFDVESDVLRVDLTQFIDDLSRRGLAEVKLD